MASASQMETGRGGQWLLASFRPSPWHTISEASCLVMWMIFAWSTASHLACAGLREATMVDAGLPSRILNEEDLEDMMPMEPLWDLLLPLLGLGIDAGPMCLRVTLGLSLAEPLLLLLLPSAQGSLREFHDRLLSWHLGGIFAHPMLVAQVVAIHAEARAAETVPRRPNQTIRDVSIARGAAALGGLVGLYALGAFVGSSLRRAFTLLDVPPLFKTLLLVVIVSASLFGLTKNGNLLESTEALQDTGHDDEHHSLLNTNNLQSALKFVRHELITAFQVVVDCKALLLARAMTLFSLTIVIGPAPLPLVDLLASTPLRRGFSVLWFDIAGILASAALLPLLPALSASLGHLNVTPIDLCKLCYPVASLACIVAAFASLRAEISAFSLAMLAGLALSVCAAFANTVLALCIYERLGQKDAAGKRHIGVALGWGLLVGGIAQMLGTKVGAALFSSASWFGVASVAGLACATGWYALESNPK